MKHLRPLYALGLALLLDACAEERIAGDLRPFVDQRITVVFSQWGIPTSNRVEDGNTIYVWASQQKALIPVTTIITASQGSPRRMDVTQTSESYVVTTVKCEVALTTDDTGIVRDFAWKGNKPGCDAYARRLEMLH